MTTLKDIAMKFSESEDQEVSDFMDARQKALDDGYDINSIPMPACLKRELKIK